jgi:hypothetical protein
MLMEEPICRFFNLLFHETAIVENTVLIPATRARIVYPKEKKRGRTVFVLFVSKPEL